MQNCQVHLRPSNDSVSSSLQHLRPTTGALPYAFHFFRRPAVLTTVLDMPPKTNDSIGVTIFPMTIHCVPPHTVKVFGILPQEPIPRTPLLLNLFRQTSLPASPYIAALGVVPQLSIPFYFSFSDISANTQRPILTLVVLSGNLCFDQV